MRAKPPSEWTPENVTARDVAADSKFVATFRCEGCRESREFNVFKVGMVLADTPLQSLRFRCQKCGLYPSVLEIGRRTSGIGDHLVTVRLRPRCWDEGHERKQREAASRLNRS